MVFTILKNINYASLRIILGNSTCISCTFLAYIYEVLTSFHAHDLDTGCVIVANLIDVNPILVRTFHDRYCTIVEISGLIKIYTVLSTLDLYSSWNTKKLTAMSSSCIVLITYLLDVNVIVLATPDSNGTVVVFSVLKYFNIVSIGRSGYTTRFSRLNSNLISHILLVDINVVIVTIGVRRGIVAFTDLIYCSLGISPSLFYFTFVVLGVGYPTQKQCNST